MSWSELRSIRVVILAFLFAGCTVGSEGESPIERVRSLQEQGRYAETIGTIRALLDDRPIDPELNRLYGLALLATNQPSLAVWPLYRVAASSDTPIEDGLLLGSAQLLSSSSADAIATATRLLEIAPDNDRVLALRGRAHHAVRQFDEALVDLERVLHSDPDNVDISILRVTALLGLGRGEDAAEALAAVERVVGTSDQQSPKSMGRLCVAAASLAMEAGNDEDAAKKFDACTTQWPGEWVVVNVAIDYYDSRGEFDRAIEVLEAGTQANPDDARMRAILGTRLGAMGRGSDALQLLTEAAEREGTTGAWAIVADYHVAAGDYSAARVAIERAIEIEREPPPVLYFAYGDTLVQLGELDRAMEVVVELRTTGEVMAMLLEGRVLLSRGRDGEALALLGQGIQRWPDNPTARFLAAQAAERVGDFDRAIEEYRQAIRADEAYTFAGLELARIYFAEGQDAAALTALRHHLVGHPGDADAFEIAVRVGRRQGNKTTMNEGLKAISLQRDGAIRATRLSAQLHRDAGSPKEAALILDAAYADNDAGAPEEDLARIVDDFLSAGEFSAAESSLGKARASLFRASEVATHEAIIALAQGKLVLAEGALARVNARAPASVKTLVVNARLLEQKGNMQGALNAYSQARRLAPDNVDAGIGAAHLVLADPTLVGADQVEAHLRELLRVAVLDPRPPELLARLLAEHSGGAAEASRLAERAVRFGGGDAARATLDQIKAREE